MKRKLNHYLILLIVLGISGCISVPKPNIVIPEKKCECKEKIVYKEVIKKAEEPPVIPPIPNKLYINLDGNKMEADSNGRELLILYRDLKIWREENY